MNKKELTELLRKHFPYATPEMLDKAVNELILGQSESNTKIKRYGNRLFK